MGKGNRAIPLLWSAKSNGSWFLYGLKLVSGRYYVGITKSPRKRIWQHCCSPRGARYTNLFPPVRNIYLERLPTSRKSEAKDAENNLTLEYMKKYGAGNVRGGDYIQSNPDQATRTRWQRELAGKRENTIELDLEVYKRACV